jgi:hypothetical protein
MWSIHPFQNALQCLQRSIYNNPQHFGSVLPGSGLHTASLSAGTSAGVLLEHHACAALHVPIQLQRETGYGERKQPSHPLTNGTFAPELARGVLRTRLALEAAARRTLIGGDFGSCEVGVPHSDLPPLVESAKPLDAVQVLLSILLCEHFGNCDFHSLHAHVGVDELMAVLFLMTCLLVSLHSSLPLGIALKRSNTSECELEHPDYQEERS